MAVQELAAGGGQVIGAVNVVGSAIGRGAVRRVLHAGRRSRLRRPRR